MENLIQSEDKPTTQDLNERFPWPGLFDFYHLGKIEPAIGVPNYDPADLTHEEILSLTWVSIKVQGDVKGTLLLGTELSENTDHFFDRSTLLELCNIIGAKIAIHLSSPADGISWMNPPIEISAEQILPSMAQATALKTLSKKLYILNRMDGTLAFSALWISLPPTAIELKESQNRKTHTQRDVLNQPHL